DPIPKLRAFPFLPTLRVTFLNLQSRPAEKKSAAPRSSRGCSPPNFDARDGPPTPPEGVAGVPSRYRFMLKHSYHPRHEENRMRHEGDTLRARRYYFENASENLRQLLRGRYHWMNRFIDPEETGVEV